MTLCLVAMTLGVAMTSCEKEDVDADGSTTNTPLPGSITVKMRNEDNGETKIYIDRSVNGCYAYLYINSANNFDLYTYQEFRTDYDVEIASVGKVNGLGGITEVPGFGWSSEVSVFVGHGYVVRCRYREYIYGSGEYTDYSDYTYTRIFVHDEIVSTGGGVIGYTVSYIEGV